MKDNNLREFYSALRSALSAYFNAHGDPQGRSDMEAVMDIVRNHMNRSDAPNRDEDGGGQEQKIGVVDSEDGLNVAYDFASHFDTGMLDSMDPLVRIELLEACIYALNNRINELETEFKKRINERRQGQ